MQGGIGFAKLAAVFALPMALVGWSIIFLATEILGLAFEKTNFGLVYVLGALLTLGVIVFFFYQMFRWFTSIFLGDKAVEEDGSNV